MNHGTIYLGSTNKAAFPVIRYVASFYWQSTYHASSFRDDIGLVRMDNFTPLGASIKPIALPTRTQALNTFTNVIMKISGWGSMEDGQLADVLQYTTVVGINDQECRATYGAKVYPSTLCTRGYPDLTQGVCAGDDGNVAVTTTAPIFAVAINSFGSISSCTDGFPQGFIRIGPYLEWINLITGITIGY